MSYPLKYKIETAINAWLVAAASSALSGYNYLIGQDRDKQPLPCIVTSVEAFEPSFELQEDGSAWDGHPRTGQVTIRVKTRAHYSDVNLATTSETAHYDAASAVETRLGNVAGLRDYANFENDVNRPVTAFYLYDVQPPRVIFGGDLEEDAFVTSFTFAVVAQNTDAT